MSPGGGEEQKEGNRLSPQKHDKWAMANTLLSSHLAHHSSERRREEFYFVLSYFSSYSWTGRINIVTMAFLPKAIYRFNAILIKIPTAFLQTQQTILKCVWNHKGPRTATAMTRKNAAGGLGLPEVKLHWGAVETPSVRSRHKHRHTAQRSKTESPEMKPRLNGAGTTGKPHDTVLHHSQKLKTPQSSASSPSSNGSSKD